MAVENITIDQIFADLDAAIIDTQVPLLDEENGEFNLNQLTERASCGAPRARDYVKRWTEEGRCEYIGKRRSRNGKIVDAWRLLK